MAEKKQPPEMVYKKGVLKNVAKFTEKASLFLVTLQASATVSPEKSF